MLLDDYIKDRACALAQVDYEIADLKRRQEILSEELREALNHIIVGTQSYTYGVYKITVKTGINYSINKEEYDVLSPRLPSMFNPVQVVSEYKLDKKKLLEARIYGSFEDIEILERIVVEKPAKLSVTIGAAK